MIAGLIAAAVLSTGQADGPPPLAEVSIVRRDGGFEAEYSFNQDAAAWVFFRSGRERRSGAHWRSSVWDVLTPGVVLVEDGQRAYLATADGTAVPQSVSIRFTPEPVGLMADYDPALIFTSGSVALFSDQFDVFPIASANAVNALPADLNAASDIPARPTQACWRDSHGAILFRGEQTLEACGSNAQTYVFFGEDGISETDALASVLDTGLPSWISDEIARFSPLVADWYTDQLGDGLDARPMIMASWNGPAAGVTSMGGSVLPGLIVMAFEGEGLQEPAARITGQIRWFIAHEVAHFWLGQTVRYERQNDMWITEGGADLAALRALEAIDPEWDGSRAFLQAALDDCAARSSYPLDTAAQRGDFRVYYACGTVFTLAMEHATGLGWPALLAEMIAATREAGVLTRADWLARFDGTPHHSEITALISSLLENGAEDSVTAIATLLEAANVPHTRDETGQIHLTP